MLFDNSEEKKEMWVKNEKHIKRVIIGIIFLTIILVLLLIFFRNQIWAIITGMAVIVGLIVDLITIFNTKRRE